MNFTPKPNGEKKFVITKNTVIEIPDCEYKEYIKRSISEHSKSDACGAEEISKIVFSKGIPNAIKESVRRTATESGQNEEFEVYGEKTKLTPVIECITDSNEEYSIIFGKETRVFTENERAFVIALSAILHLSDKDEIRDGAIYDVPDVSERIYRIYLPGRESIGDFEKMLDLLVYYKYNAIILEIGGAMEYERHPKINEKWVEFCKDLSRYSGRSDEIQYSQHWKKNSIHYENGDGSYLTKEECRAISKMCRERGIEIIPECPTLSHADYICMAYPEISERNDDPYPDTYCPSNPESYRIAFDILDEVIEVFNPRRINIGHDEFYTVGICEKCKGKDPSKIYADDVHKINEYLKSRGITTMMWAEKLLKARANYDQYKVGGWYDACNCNGVMFQVPDMWRCADLLPDDVTYIHWYWPFGEHLDDEFHARNFKVIFGNFSVVRCTNYRTRRNRGVMGGAVSNWGSFAPEYMQRNMQYFGLISTAYAFNSHTYTNNDKDELIHTTFEEMYRLRMRSIKNPLTVRHSVNHEIKYKPFHCGIFIEDSEYLFGHYRVTYEDGKIYDLPVKYGTNIGYKHTGFDSAHMRETGYSTLPISDGKTTVYEHAYENPNPDHKITKIEYIPASGKKDIIPEYEFIF